VSVLPLRKIRPETLMVDMFYCVATARDPRILHIASEGQAPETVARRWPTLCKSGRIKEVMYPTDFQLVSLEVCPSCQSVLDRLESGQN
jgi:hypothetical protein